MASNATNLHGRPPLPPRQGQPSSLTAAAASSSSSDAPPPYNIIAHQQKAYDKATSAAVADQDAGLMHNDPRSSSQQSLLPEYEEHDQRRTLLLIYVHGFMGNETSFRSFPAHVHNLLVILLSESHVVHTKIYPRYRSRGHISIARNDFGKWLEPHESGSVDVILLGHSMGGLLAAEVALMPSSQPMSRPLAHRILGTINFDVPFLGMHPGVVKSGLSSIFKPSEETHEDKWTEATSQASSQADNIQPGSTTPASPPSRSDTLWAPGNIDPNFNPAFQNDVNLPVRKGWSNAWHFISKHSGELVNSTKKLVSSHLEFGGAMANYAELKARYTRIRALEEVDERVRKSVVQGGIPPRVRFINYYTASTGRPKKAGASGRDDHGMGPQLSDVKTPIPLENEQWDDAMESLRIEDSTTRQPSTSSLSIQTDTQSTPSVPPSAPPPLGDLSYIKDTSVRQMVEKEHQQAVEAYERALAENKAKSGGSSLEQQDQSLLGTVNPEPSRNVKAEPDSKMTHQERETLRLEKEKQRMEAEARRMRGEQEPERPKMQSKLSGTSMSTVERRSASSAPSIHEPLASVESKSAQEGRAGEESRPKKDRKFCVLPPKDSNGERDPCWVRVFMENVDEVGAHCGLFFVDERYERLVGDVAERVENWVKESNGTRGRGASVKS